MPKAPPSLDFYPNDWHGGTKHLTLIDRACYLELLLYQWANGHLPIDPLVRGELCGLPPDTFRSVWARISDKFSPIEWGDGSTVLVNLRMHEDREHAISKWRKNKEAAKLGGLATQRKHKNNKKGRTASKRPSRKGAVSEGGRWKEEGINTNPNSNPNPKGQRKGKFQPPTFEDVEGYVREKGLGIDPQGFVDYYAAQGWTLANGRPMRNWQAAARLWASRQRQDAAKPKSEYQAYLDRCEEQRQRQARQEAAAASRQEAEELRANQVHLELSKGLFKSASE